MRCFKTLFIASTILTSSIASVQQVSAADSLEQAFKEGTPYIDARYRYEFVDQDGVAEDAHASTLRTRLGYKSGEFKNFSGVLEFENITQIGSDNFNDTLNRRTDHPVVADVENTEVNQAFLQFTGIPDTRVRVGRERINIDNQRFIGSVGWRQNDQTFDAGTIVNTSIPDTTVTYGYINNVNRIFGDDSAAGDFESNSHIVNIANKSTPLGTITAYGYFLDFEDEAPALSNQTFGISLVGKQALNDDGLWFKYRGEYAHQSDHGDNTTEYDADYFHIAPALSWQGLTATVGYEVLGSDNGVAGFATPLATLHKFNGFADKFLGTPAAGLEDMYIDLTYKLSGVEGDMDFLNGLLVKFQYHDFESDEGGVDYGSEFGTYVKLPIQKHYYVEAKYADYDADNFATDTQKFILGVGVKY